MQRIALHLYHIAGGVPKTTTANWHTLNATNCGSAGSKSNVLSIQPGDALNSTSKGHVVLITAVNANGTYEITEQTPPQITRKTCSVSEICNDYQTYTIYRYNKRENVSAPPSYSPLTTPTITTNKSSYIVGETVNLTWATSPSNSNLSHYWLQIFAPDGTTYLNESMYKNNSYSFKATQGGIYRIVSFATPVGSLQGEGSVTSEKSITVYANKPSGLSIKNDKSKYAIGETVTFSFTSSDETELYIPIDYNGVRMDFINVTNKNTYSCSFEKPGKYGYFLVARNSAGETTTVNEYKEFIVYTNQTLTFNANGGITPTTTKSILYNTAYGTLPTPTRTGYNFVGWFTEKDNGAQIKENSIVSVITPLTVYAHWTANKYSVKFDGNGANELNKANKDVTYDSTYGELPIPKRSGYNFIGWYTQAEGGTMIDSNTKVSITAPQTLYAQWSVNKFLITFNATGGIAQATQKLVTYDKTYGVLPTAEKTGYAFKGWYLDEAYTKPITSDSMVTLTTNQNVYAKWELQKYIITFNATGGAVEAESKLVTFGKSYGVLPSAFKDGVKFVGWYTIDDVEIKSTDIVEIQENITLYAKWEIEVTLSGDTNCDNEVNIADVVILKCYLINSKDYSITEQGKVNADINNRGNGLNTQDSLAILKYLLKLIDTI